MSENNITQNIVESLALAGGMILTSDDSAALVASVQATANDMATLDALDLKDVEPALTVRADPQGDSR